MENQVQLTVTGHQKDEFGAETVTATKAVAEYYERNGTTYIFYEEIPEGTGAVIKNTIKFKNNVLELTKKGALNTRMVFDTENDFRVDYQTPFGCLQMDIHTVLVACTFREGLPQITAEYTLTSEENLLSRSIVTISLSK